MDRVLAILGILLEEYDADSRPPAPEYQLPGEYSDMEIRRVSTYSEVCQYAGRLSGSSSRVSHGPGYGTHRHEIATTSISARTARRTADVQVCNNVRCGVEGREGFGRPAKRFNFRANLELNLKAEMHPLYVITFFPW